MGIEWLDERAHRIIRIVLCVCFFVCILVVLTVGCLARELTHDEHVFVASGALLSRAGLLPYVDYAYFHLPNLVFIYAALFRTNDFLLLTARSFNVFSAWLLLCVVFAVATSQFRFLRRHRWTVAGCFALILLLDPRFRHAVGRAWNHDLPVLSSVGAFLALLRATNRQSTRLEGKQLSNVRWFVISGALLGLAIGTRATFAPLLVPFAALSCFLPPREQRTFANAAWLITGVAISLIPTVILFSLAPHRFVYDNFVYNAVLNLQWEYSYAPAHTTLLRKFCFALSQFKSPPSLFLVGGFAYFCVWPAFFWRHGGISRENAGVLSLVPFLLLGAAMPKANHPQYYYMLVPFLLLGVIFGMARRWNSAAATRLILPCLLLTVTVGMAKLVTDIRSARSMANLSDWPVFAAHHLGQRVAQMAGTGPVLTLAPIYPLEGRAMIYKEFATGPFAWRTAPFVTGNREQPFYFVDATDLEDFLRLHPPEAVLTGFEDEALEAPLKEYAKRNGFRKMNLTGATTLWVTSAKPFMHE